ncbi:37 kDa inner envelope membrane protein [Musa troglodytarum]|uniref:37 kDa inner envelope membrane protein n=1 Tax=Musa troglodytarum TaxID=320322 RepID=A0A9E7JNL9_9LILI|nr:37 kDa inner envelope membrane protein [Musa troglodytarum]
MTLLAEAQRVKAKKGKLDKKRTQLPKFCDWSFFSFFILLQEDAAAIKAASPACYKTMISDCDSAVAWCNTATREALESFDALLPAVLRDSCIVNDGSKQPKPSICSCSELTKPSLSGAEALTFPKGITPTGLGFRGSSLSGICLPKMGVVSVGGGSMKAKSFVPGCTLSSSRPASQPRFIQHKKEAFWFYRFLSVVYDHIINPGHWTEDMRDEALEPADLYDARLKVVDVGGGTGFTTLGIVKHIYPKNVTILDQSPHQLEKARQKEELKECTIIEGDAEELPFPTDSVDRYISAGSIEYWPDPQRGIKEAYRVLKLGGLACIIGPVYPTFWLSRFFADMWMLFPKEEEYIEWFKKAGFKDVKLKRIGPKWYRGVRRHGLIMGCSVTGVKRESGDSPLQLGPKVEDVKKPVNPFAFVLRFILGTIAATYYVLVPIYMWIKDKIVPKGQPI